MYLLPSVDDMGNKVDKESDDKIDSPSCKKQEKSGQTEMYGTLRRNRFPTKVSFVIQKIMCHKTMNPAFYPRWSTFAIDRQ